MRFEDDGGEHLDPVGHQLAVAGGARLAGLGVGAQPIGSLARHQARLAVGRSGSDRLQRLGDPAGDELVVAGRVRSLVWVHRPLAALAGVMPSLRPGQQLGEAVRALAVGGNAAVELAAVTALAVAAVEAHPRACMLSARTSHPSFAPRLPHRRHLGPDATVEARQNTQLEATGGLPSPDRAASCLR